MPVCASEAAESGNQEEEDEEEDEVGAERTDHVDEAEETHPDLEESCGEANSQLCMWCVLRTKITYQRLR